MDATGNSTISMVVHLIIVGPSWQKLVAVLVISGIVVAKRHDYEEVPL